MRAFFATFLLSWVVGVAAGVFGWGVGLFIVGSFGIAAFAWWQRLATPFLLMACILVLFGWVYGGIVRPTVTTCEPIQAAVVRITSVQKVTEQTVRYVTTTQGGCRV